MYHGGRFVLVFRNFFTSVFLLALMTLSSGCSWFGGDDELVADSGEQQLYREAQRHLKNENFSLAVRSLQMLESRYPFGRYAEQAQLELIYAHYGAYEYAAANEAADRFIRLHPRHPSVDYAFYMKGLAAYDIEPGFFSRFIPSDDTKRDVSHIQIAFAEFSQLLARYPDSAYAPDARQRMVHMRNMLARHAGRLLHMFHDILTPIQRRHVGAAPEVVIGDVDFVACQHIAHVHHALPRVGSIGAVWVSR